MVERVDAFFKKTTSDTTPHVFGVLECVTPAPRTGRAEAKIGQIHGLQGGALTGQRSQGLAHRRNRTRHSTKSKAAELGGKGWKMLQKQ